ncbi:MAG: endolytic transglycosylase MltG [Bdellovibrionales bacterium]
MGGQAANKAGRFVLGFVVYGFTIAIAISACALWWGAHAFQKPGPAQESAIFVVARGEGANTIAGKLYGAHLIDDPFLFMIAVTVLGEHTNLKAGEYEIPAGASAARIMAMLRDHDIVARRVTIREGLTSFEVVRLLNGVAALSGDITQTPPEGSLLPDTYDYQREEPRSAVSARMQNAMRGAIIDLCGLKNASASWADFLNQPCGAAPLKTVRDVVTLASIVEKETGKPEERARVAGVFLNRLKAGIPLQTDPSVIYAITGGEHKNDGKGPLGRRLLSKDLQIDSPYNTYKNAGLPPGPIANPGRASIAAVLTPESHDYLFFVADGSGGHVFAKTLAEHNRNVAEWRKIRRGQ